MFPNVNVQNNKKRLQGQAEGADLPGWVTACLGLEAWASLGSAASWAPGSLALDNGIGDGKKCLGKPLKNQAPDLFHT